MSNPIQELATRTGYGINRLARLLGVDKATIQRWRNCATPNEAATKKIAHLLTLSATELDTVATLLTRLPERTEK
jgi:transposase-like protein